MIVKNLHFKIIPLFLIGGIFFSLGLEESQDTPSFNDEVLEVRKQFPRYRVFYNHQKVVKEVQDELKSKDSEDSSSKK